MNELSWLQKHERLLLGTFVLVVILWLGNKYLNRSADEANFKSAQAQLIVEQQKAANDAQAKQTASLVQQYQGLAANLAAENAALARGIASRNTATKSQQAADASMGMPELAARWQTVAALKPGDVAVSGSSITVTQLGAVATVSQLEETNSCTANLQDEQSIEAHDQLQLSKLSEVNAGLNQQIGGLNKQIEAADNACKLQVNAVKADARKSKRNWALTMLSVGIALGKILLK